MQDRIARIDETSCTARPDHTLGSLATEAAASRFRFVSKADVNSQTGLLWAINGEMGGLGPVAPRSMSLVRQN
jgi:hypothetical protein